MIDGIAVYATALLSGAGISAVFFYGVVVRNRSRKIRSLEREKAEITASVKSLREEIFQTRLRADALARDFESVSRQKDELHRELLNPYRKPVLAFALKTFGAGILCGAVVMGPAVFSVQQSVWTKRIVDVEVRARVAEAKAHFYEGNLGSLRAEYENLGRKLLEEMEQKFVFLAKLEALIDENPSRKTHGFLFPFGTSKNGTNGKLAPGSVVSETLTPLSRPAI